MFGIHAINLFLTVLLCKYRKKRLNLAIQREGGWQMVRSPCLDCERVNEDKNKCLADCEKLKEYQEMILKMGIYATM